MNKTSTPRSHCFTIPIPQVANERRSHRRLEAEFEKQNEGREEQGRC
jgi:hypothetical protein